PPGPSGSHQYLRARRTGWMSASATPAVFGSAPASRCRPMRDPPRRGGGIQVGVSPSQVARPRIVRNSRDVPLVSPDDGGGRMFDRPRRKMSMKRSFSIAVVAIPGLALAALAAPAAAWNCPVQIKAAEDAIKRAESMKLTPDAKRLVDGARVFLAEAKKHHI